MVNQGPFADGQTIPVTKIGRWFLALAILMGLATSTYWIAASDSVSARLDASPEANSGEQKTLDDVITVLRDAGLNVEVTDQTVTQDFFKVPARIILVNGQDLQVFVYESEDARKADSEQISEDGTQIGTSMITWVAKPHFEVAANIMTLFVSNDEDLAQQIADAIARLAPPDLASPVASPIAGVWTVDDVVAALRSAQLVVEVTDQTVNHEFFAVPATILQVNGQDLQVFVYPSAIARARDFAKIGPDGSIIGSTTIVEWVAPPHFAAAANIMTLLVPADDDLAMAIEQAVATLG